MRRFARSLGYLDWATQPDPFRGFDGADRIDLSAALRAAATTDPGHPPRWADVSFDDVIEPGLTAPTDPGLAAVSLFLRFSLGLSAWKQAGASRWALRVNPSSGNLHPTEGYVVLGPGVVPGGPGVFHYAPDRHALERRAAIGEDGWRTLGASLPRGAFLAGLTSIHWREAWKYGERAFRYCQHDVGHAVAAMSMAAAMIGWRARVLPAWSSAGIAALLGVDRGPDFEGAEPEQPGCLLLIWSGEAPSTLPNETPDIVAAARAAAWTGRANRLSSDHVQWDWVDAAAEATQVVDARDQGERGHLATRPWSRRASRPGDVQPPPAWRLLLQRRSAVSMHDGSRMGLDPFLFLLRRTLPTGQPPFDALWWTPRLHLVLFVHRIEGLEPGLYVLPRSPAGRDALQDAFHGGFAWIRPEGVPDDLPFYLLEAGDLRRVARALSCTQDIASDGCFSLGMLAEFSPALDTFGASFYRNLFWEAGAIGQALYLEAEAAGCRGTGIGCFFDDAVHELLGLRGDRFQSLYHFTVGMPVDDPRLQTEPGYTWEAPPPPPA